LPSWRSRTRSCRPVWPGSVYVPGPRVDTRADTSREAPCLLRSCTEAPFVSALCPLYWKHSEMARNEMSGVWGFNPRCLSYHSISGSFMSVQSWIAWGARGRRFKSCRPDQIFSLISLSSAVCPPTTTVEAQNLCSR
jgi:hypothetical protein